MSSRDRTLLIAIAVLVVLAGGWFAIISPKRSESAALGSDLTAARASLLQANADVARFTQARADLRADAKALRAAGKALPTRVAMPALLRELERTATRDGVTMTALTTSAASAVTATVTTPPATGSAATPATSGISSMGLSLTFTGRFVDLQRYLATLQRFVRVSAKNVDATGRLFAMNGVRLGAGPNGLPSLSASVDATVYMLDPAAAQAATQAPATATVPGAAPAAASTGSSPTPTATAEVPR
jgi:hypothetical protein